MINKSLMEHYLYEIRNAITIEEELEEFQGWCDIASSLFSTILKKHHQIDVKLVSGAVETMDERKGHYWNSFEGTVIDLTADQFGFEEGIIDEDLFEDCYVGNKVVCFPHEEEIYTKYIRHIKIIKSMEDNPAIKEESK